MWKKYLFLIVVAIVFSVVRFFLVKHPLSFDSAYQAFAHLFVGGLIGAWVVSKQKFYGLLVLLLSIVELVAFFK